MRGGKFSLYLGSQEVAELQASDDGDFLCLKILVRKMALRASRVARPASSEGVTGGCMDRTSLKVGLNQDRPVGVALGEERKWRWGGNEGKTNEGEEISGRARRLPWVSG